MPTLTLKTEDGERSYGFVAGHPLRYLLDSTDFRVRSGCRGMGACGLCLVRIHTGKTEEPKINERLHLDDSQLEQGVRLACQIVPTDDMTVEILAPAPLTAWRFLDHQDGPQPKPTAPIPLPNIQPPVKIPYGVAVDLGTTHISMSIFHLRSGRWLAGRYGANAQASYGSDIMTRLVAAVESPANAQALSQSVIHAIGDALWDIAIRECIDLQQVVLLTLVGNTAMLSLLSGRNFDLLLQPNHWMGFIDCLPEDTQAWVDSWSIHPQAQLIVVPPLAGFVGSDLLAGVVATDLLRQPGSLLIDFGTNSEIALWDGSVLWSTSAAGGPAFEGSGIRCGMPAEPGAISQVHWRSDKAPEYTVIGDCEPTGICGSGLVDAIAGLLDCGKLSAVGRFAPPITNQGFTLVPGDRAITISPGDVDAFQRAKAAIGVGIDTLLEQAGLGYKDLQRVCVGGAFGRALDIANAQSIGLLPSISPHLVELCGNTALTGCERTLLSSATLVQIRRLGEQTKIVNLSQSPDFDLLFLENLFLRPMRRE